MKNKKTRFVIFFSAIVLLGIVTTAHAALNIETGVGVPASCTATDTDGVAHSYPQADSSSSYLAICALEAATENGSVSNVQLSNKFPSLGLFVAAINDVAADPNSQYWAIYQNGAYANFGIASLPVVAGDTIMFQLHNFSDNNLGDQVTIHINSLDPTPVHPSSRGNSDTTYYYSPILNYVTTFPQGEVLGAATVHSVFDQSKAFSFLISNQKADGSFGEDLYTDWVALALGVTDSYKLNTEALRSYFLSHTFSPTLITDYERRAMALMSLGLNPYNTNGENYIEKITSQFDGKQFGDINEDNDDIFALIVLQNAGYTQNEKMINDDISFILSRQKDDGSWDNSADMTGAGIEALSLFSPTPGVGESLAKAKNFLKQNQKDNGSWNDSASSTAWATEGILALSEKPEDWVKNNNTPLDYLATLEDTNGGIKNDNLQNKIWETAYVASALSGKTWNQTMQKFEKPKTETAKIAPATPVKKPAAKKIATINTGADDNTLSKPENLGSQNTAAVINTAITTQTENPKKEWFARFLNKIFSIF